MTEPMQFDKAEFEEGAAPATCVACGKPIAGEYWAANGKVCCPGCRDRIAAGPHPAGAPRRLAKALLFGAGGGILGAIAWWAVAHFAKIEAGIIAIAVGFLVGGGVRLGAERVGGRGYQVLAVGLTWMSIGGAYTPFVRAGLLESPEGGGIPGVVLTVLAFVLALFAPFAGGIKNVLGIIIVGIAFWEAWRLNGRPKIEWSGPHRVAPVPAASAPPPPLPG